MIEDCEKIAYGVLELKPWEFYKLTPAEFFKLHAGYLTRDKIETKKIIILANAKFYEKPLKLPEDENEKKAPKTKEEQRRELEKLKQEFTNGGR